jgi:hypothetical protein
VAVIDPIGNVNSLTKPDQRLLFPAVLLLLGPSIAIPALKWFDVMRRLPRHELRADLQETSLSCCGSTPASATTTGHTPRTCTTARSGVGMLPEAGVAAAEVMGIAGGGIVGTVDAATGVGVVGLAPQPAVAIRSPIPIRTIRCRVPLTRLSQCIDASLLLVPRNRPVGPIVSCPCPGPAGG